MDTNLITKTVKFDGPIARKKNGESDQFTRSMYYDWVLSMREQCIRQKTSFEFRQCGTHFIKDDREYTLQKKDLCSQARKVNIRFQAK